MSFFIKYKINKIKVIVRKRKKVVSVILIHS